MFVTEIRISRYMIAIADRFSFNRGMVKNEKSVHFYVKKELFLRIQNTASTHHLSMSQLLRHLVEKSLNLIEIGTTLLDVPSQKSMEIKPSKEGNTYVFRNLQYTVGGL